jgi:hypothetical protein
MRESNEEIALCAMLYPLRFAIMRVEVLVRRLRASRLPAMELQGPASDLRGTGQVAPAPAGEGANKPSLSESCLTAQGLRRGTREATMTPWEGFTRYATATGIELARGHATGVDSGHRPRAVTATTLADLLRPGPRAADLLAADLWARRRNPTPPAASTTPAPRPKVGSEEIRRPRPGSEGDTPVASRVGGGFPGGARREIPRWRALSRFAAPPSPCFLGAARRQRAGRDMESGQCGQSGKSRRRFLWHVRQSTASIRTTCGVPRPGSPSVRDATATSAHTRRPAATPAAERLSRAP